MLHSNHSPMMKIICLTISMTVGFALLVVDPQPALANSVIGSGTPDSCTEAKLRQAMQNGGTITFNCGSAATTITISSALEVTAPETTIDGGGTITLEGNNSRIIKQQTLGFDATTLTLKNLTITKARVSGAGEAGNGAAILSVNSSANDQAFPPTLHIINVTFTDNDATVTSAPSGHAYDYGGGAIFSTGGIVTITGSTFINNDANQGGGGAIHILRSNLSVLDSNFVTNSAIGSATADSHGGAIYIDGLRPPDGAVSIVRSRFSGNMTFNSGGAIHVNMYENSSQFTVDQSSFTDNGVVGGDFGQGGAIGGGTSSLGTPDTGNASITITNSTFSNNAVKRNGADGSGGALGFTQQAVIKIANSTFSGNRAEGTSFGANGGAIYIGEHKTPFEITNTTIAGNYAGWTGGAITASSIGSDPGGVLRNTIIANNTAGGIPLFQQHCSQELTDGGNNLQFPGRQTDGNFFNDVTCFKGKSAPDQKNLPDFRDPQLGPLADNGGPTETMAIAPSSPAFDGGSNGNCPLRDQRGISRPQGSTCDIGAYELVLTLSVNPQLVSKDAPDFTLTVIGTGFTQNSKIVWRGQELATTFVDSSTLLATVSTEAIGAVGTAEVKVSDSSLPAATVRVVDRVIKVFLPIALR